MPVYEYRCPKGHTFEVVQRMSDDPVSECEVCSRPVQRVLHPVAVHFKGKGFYNTDYGTKKRQRELAAAGEGSSKDGKSDSGKADSKSDSGATETKKADKAESSTSEKKSDGPKSKPDSAPSKPAPKPAA